MSNIFANLELPVDARIYLAFYRPYVSKAARALEEAEMCAEVRRAIQAWYYETYC